MDASVEPPSLSYPQLFSFQVSYTSQSEYRNSIIPEGSKKGEWRHGILEVDFLMETFFLQDRDRIFLSQAFSAFNNHAEDISSDNCSLSLIFSSDQWEIAAQNTAEKMCLQHLLECIVKNIPIEDVVQEGKEKGIIGLDKSIIKHGKVQRKAINEKRLDERYLLLCPGKLFVFKNFDIKGKHVRYVTSLLGAAIRMLSEEREFQILAPGSKTITLIPQSQEDLNAWVDSLAISIGHTKQVGEGTELSAKEEKRSDVRFSKDKIVQQTSDSVSHRESSASRASHQPNKFEEAGQSLREPRTDTAIPNSLTQRKTGCNANEFHQEVDCTVPKSKQTFKQEDKENKDARRPCSVKSSSSKQSRAMKYLENALDEMEIIVGSIRTTRKLSGSRIFDSSDNRRNKTGGISPLRSSWDFDWKAKEEQCWKGKGTYTERRGREREQPCSPCQVSKTREYNKVARFAAWKQPIVQTGKSWQSNKTSDSKRKDFESCSPLRYSLDSTAGLNRTRDLSNLPSYVGSQQEQAQGRKSSSMEVQNVYSDAASSPPAARPATAANTRFSSKMELSPATQNLLKKHSSELLAAETNSLGRRLQTGSASSHGSRDADNRQALYQSGNLQQQRMRNRSTLSSVGTMSSTSEEEEDEEDDDAEEDQEKNGNGSSCRPHALRLVGNGNSHRDCALLDGLSRVKDNVNAPEQLIQCRQPSSELSISRKVASLDQKDLLTGAQHIRHHSQVQQETSTRASAQQSLGHTLSKQSYGASEVSSDSKPGYSEKIDSLLEPTTPKVGDESQSNQNIFTSHGKGNNANTLQDPIYDPDFTGPQIINRRQSRLAQQEISFHPSADLRNSYDIVGPCHSLVKTQPPNFAEAAATQYTRRSCGSELISNISGDPCKSLYGERESVDVSAQDGPSLYPTYRRQQETEIVRQPESSVSSVLPQQGHTRLDHGSVHANELPELVNRISKITAAIDGRYQQGYQMVHEAAIDPTPGYSNTTNSMQVEQETMNGPYQRALKGSSQSNNGFVFKIAPEQSTQPLSLVKGSRPASDDHINVQDKDGHMRWSSTGETTTAFRDLGHFSQRQSNAEDGNTGMGIFTHNR